MSEPEEFPAGNISDNTYNGYQCQLDGITDLIGDIACGINNVRHYIYEPNQANSYKRSFQRDFRYTRHKNTPENLKCVIIRFSPKPQYFSHNILQVELEFNIEFTIELA